MCGRSMSHYTWDCQLLALLALLASGLSILEIFNYSQCGISIPCITCIMTHYVWAHYESVYVEFSIFASWDVQFFALLIVLALLALLAS